MVSLHRQARPFGLSFDLFRCRHHESLASRLVASIECFFEPVVFREDDFGGIPGRAAGGLVVQQFKIDCILKALDELKGNEYMVWSDADVQPFSVETLRRRIEEVVGSGEDAYAQREFEECGVNVGFLILKKSARSLFENLKNEMTRTKALDQKVLNRMILAGTARVSRLPSIFWASSNAAAKPNLQDLVLHHANFVLAKDHRDSRDPRPKLDQLDTVLLLVQQNDQANWANFLDILGTSCFRTDFIVTILARRCRPELTQVQGATFPRERSFSLGCPREREEHLS